MKKLIGVLCILCVSALATSAADNSKTKKEAAAAPPVETTPATAAETDHNVIVTRLGAEIPEQPELEPVWGGFIKRAWPYWRENYWIDRGPWPGANQGVFYRKEEPKIAGAEAVPMPPEGGITPVTPEGKVEEPLLPQPAPPVASNAPDSYTVKKGDCLWFIAGKVYGDPLKWTRIFKANKGKIKNPDRIYPGQVLTIPPLN